MKLTLKMMKIMEKESARMEIPIFSRKKQYHQNFVDKVWSEIISSLLILTFYDVFIM